MLEILGDERIPYEGERKRFRAEGDFLVRALVDLISQCCSQIHQLGRDFEELEKLAGEHELPRDVLKQCVTWSGGKERWALARHSCASA